ncbi:MAG: sigma-54 dependent transcriptional regulator [Pseudomonadales bacterium]|jgi:DNA-binding NtrC family response regulator|nr:sigma-54 dependent transcriptional regulator [Pseudomonadales bacterium]
MPLNPAQLLVIDDDRDVLTAANLLLKRRFSQVLTETQPERIPALLHERNWDLILLDMNFALGASDGQEGLYWLQEIMRLQPGATVILMTAYGAVETAVKAMKLGAADFILKPWHNERLLTTIGNTLRLRASEQELGQLQAQRRELGGGGGTDMIGTAPAMQMVYRYIERAAPTDANVLLQGENGTGKELVARALHQGSPRAREVFVSVDLGSINENLFESELFGHKKGAFTGAAQDRCGRLQAAHGGTLFLDEVANLPLPLQSKLLSVLEQRVVLPVGSNTPMPIDVRVISATNASLPALVREGLFREDLLYRLNTVQIALPPLRERRSDIPLLLKHYLEHYCNKYKFALKQLDENLLDALMDYRWPGNVRELRHAVERAVIMSPGDKLELHELLPSASAAPVRGLDEPAAPRNAEPLTLDLDSLERQAIINALKHHGGNVSHAARSLGLTRTSLYRRMEKHGL